MYILIICFGFLSYSQCRTLAQHCHNIERLDLSGCKKITDQAIYAISKHCAKMTGINLESCVNITDKSLKNIADGCPVRLYTHFTIHVIDELDLAKCDSMAKCAH